MKIHTGTVSLIFLTLQICNAQRSCPETTECINLQECPALMQVLQQSNRKPSTTQYLRDQQCGFEGRNPLVCCPQGKNESSTMEPPSREINLRNNPLLPVDCGSDLTQRIVGGEKTDIDEFPWMVLLEFNGTNGNIKLDCGGALINNRYVLTAGHCVLPNLIGVRLGEYNTDSDTDCVQEDEKSMKCADSIVRTGIEEKIPYHGYVATSRNQFDDIALLRLDKEIQFTDFIRPICLPEKQEIPQKFVSAGWGKTEDRSESNIKLKVSLPLVDMEQCQTVYNSVREISENQLCAGGEKTKDTCRGDSGGPLMSVEPGQDGIGRWTTIGVVSYGHRFCGKEGWPGVYTKVSAYTSWIINNLKP